MVMISDFYREYFQKSKTFIYPLLNIPKNKFVDVVNTYMIWEDDSNSKYDLVVCYNPNDTHIWKLFEADILKHKWLKSNYIINGLFVCVFDMYEIKDDYDIVLKGKYSAMSEYAKSVIEKYFNKRSLEWEHVETYLYPDKFYELYANMFVVDKSELNTLISIFKQTKELCPKPDMDKEIYRCEVLI